MKLTIFFLILMASITQAAQLVLISDGTERNGAVKGDIVSVHDDHVDLSGPGYAHFEIMKVNGTAAEVMATFPVVEAVEPKEGEKATELKKFPNSTKSVETMTAISAIPAKVEIEEPKEEVKK